MLPKQETNHNSKSALAITINKNDHSPSSGFHYVGVVKKSKQKEDPLKSNAMNLTINSC